MNQPPVALIPMLCTRCQTPVEAKPDEVLWVCANCGQGLLLDDEKGLVAQAVHYAAGLPQNTPGKPVWVFYGQVVLQRETFNHLFGDKRDEMVQFWQQPRWFFIPAYDLPLEPLIDTCVNLLRQPIGLQEGASPAPFLPVTVHPDDLRPLVEYLILAVEAERKDQLKSLNFTLQMSPPELWVMP